MTAYPTVTLKRGAESRVFGGHLWVFSNELADGFQSFEPGTFVRVVDSRGRFYGIGSVNPHSLIAVRLWTRQDEVIDRDFVYRRLDAARAARLQTLGDDSVCRIAFSEADFLPGIIIDRFEQLVVYQTLTAGSDGLGAFVLQWIIDRLAPNVVVQANDSSMRALEGLPMERAIVHSSLVGDIAWFKQDGLSLPVDPVRGQKTGFFLDQRLNRKLMQSFLRGGESVLDLFCYSGAFGLYALSAGAGQVTFVDGSDRALGITRDAVTANGFSNVEYVKADIFEWLKEPQRQFDVVSLDPPALAKSRSKATVALRAYRDLNARAMKWVKPGGLLLTSSCSGLISRQNWRSAVEEGAFKSRRTVRFLAFGTQAPDHPVLAAMPETEYLKFAVLQVL